VFEAGVGDVAPRLAGQRRAERQGDECSDECGKREWSTPWRAVQICVARRSLTSGERFDGTDDG